MKITLYNKNGEVFQELECVDIYPYCGNLKTIVLETNGSFAHSYIPAKSMYTNLPFIAKDNGNMLKFRQPDKTDPSYRVIMLSDIGETIDVWENAKGLGCNPNTISFKVHDTWFTICGNLVIEEMKNNE